MIFFVKIGLMIALIAFTANARIESSQTTEKSPVTSASGNDALETSSNLSSLEECKNLCLTRTLLKKSVSRDVAARECKRKCKREIALSQFNSMAKIIEGVTEENSAISWKSKIPVSSNIPLVKGEDLAVDLSPMKKAFVEAAKNTPLRNVSDGASKETKEIWNIIKNTTKSNKNVVMYTTEDVDAQKVSNTSINVNQFLIAKNEVFNVLKSTTSKDVDVLEFKNTTLDSTQLKSSHIEKGATSKNASSNVGDTLSLTKNISLETQADSMNQTEVLTTEFDPHWKLKYFGITSFPDNLDEYEYVQDPFIYVPENWCDLTVEFTNSDNVCTTLPHKKECVVTCHRGYKLNGTKTHTFTCFAKDWLEWIPPLEVCEPDQTDPNILWDIDPRGYRPWFPIFLDNPSNKTGQE